MTGSTTRTEVIERLRQRAADFNGGLLHDYDRETIALLTDAADLLEAGESRVEYRVVGDRLGGDRELVIADDLDRGLAESYVYSYSRDPEYANVRIQESTSTPWTDVEAEEVDRG